MNDKIKTAEAHAMGWTAQCPYCDTIQEVSPECEAPEGEYVNCENCQGKFQIEGIYGV